MRIYKGRNFGEGLTHTLSDFKKDFKLMLVGLTEDEAEKAHKIATKGNKLKDNGESIPSTRKSEKDNAKKGK